MLVNTVCSRAENTASIKQLCYIFANELAPLVPAITQFFGQTYLYLTPENVTGNVNVACQSTETLGHTTLNKAAKSALNKISGLERKPQRLPSV